MLTQEFSQWLTENGLVEVFTTSAGDSLYVNISKKFGVIRKNGEFGVQSFYLDDVVEIVTYDDEKRVVEWSVMYPWRVHERSTRFSTNEVYMKLMLCTRQEFRIQIFRATGRNISRDSAEHVNLLNYAHGLTQSLYQCVQAAKS